LLERLGLRVLPVFRVVRLLELLTSAEQQMEMEL
jgi:hypothetical protein